MIVKVCGMRDAQNIGEVECLCAPDMMGFIFYPKSARFVGQKPAYLPTSCQRVGVFVDASIGDILSKVEEYSLDYVQLHGHESVDMCRYLHQYVKLIKTIPIGCADDVDLALDYEDCSDILLFETKCEGFGGSGRSFDWSLLDGYKGRKPFLLTGGISSGDADRLSQIKHPMFAGVDVNSAFEIAPALKDTQLLSDFIENISGMCTAFTGL